MSQVPSSELDIRVDEHMPVFRVTKELQAPVSRVFRAHVDPDQFVQWLGPSFLKTTVEHWDCRTGGSWRYCSRDDAGATYLFFGCYHLVIDDTVIIRTYTFEGLPEVVVLERTSFESVSDDLTKVHVLNSFDSLEHRDDYIAAGMQFGIDEGYQLMQQLLDQP